MPAKRGATSLGHTIPMKKIKRERLESELSDISSWSKVPSGHTSSSDTVGSPTIPPSTTTSSEQGTADPSDTYDDPDAPLSRRTRPIRACRTRPFNKPSPLQKPTRPNKPASGHSEKAAPKRSPDLDVKFLTGRVIALKERAASLEHEKEDLKALNQELKTKYEVLAEKVAGLAGLLRREA
ncbi:MAG: hypothetical protein Q9192_008605 [Flavoplaca navasiana]